MSTDLPPLPEGDEYTQHLRTLVERVNGFVYAGDRCEAVIKTLKVLRDDPALAAVLLTGQPLEWRVVYISRADIGEPDRDEGVHRFPDEASARAYFASDEVTSRMGEYWRAELRARPWWYVVDSYPYRTASATQPA